MREGRLVELRRLKHFDMHEVVDKLVATGHVVDAKWVDRQKGSVVRSRLVARQFATKFLEHLFAGTPDAAVLRAILSNLATSTCAHPRTREKRQTLEAEAGDGRPQDSMQIVAGPLCGGRGAGGRDDLGHLER